MDRPPELVKWLTFLGTLACTCEYEFKGLGRLYGISLGNGWIRVTTEPTCPEHGEGNEKHLR